MALSIQEYLTRGPATSKEIQAATGLSQAAVSRQLRRMEDHVIRLQRGRSPHYAITRNAFGSDDELPLYMVDAYGNNVMVATIRPLAHGGFFVDPITGMPAVLSGEDGSGLYDDLPYFLSDLRPQGFLGQQIAKQLADQSNDFPPDPRDWSTDHIGRYLVANGDDLPGNFKFGHQAHLRIRRKPAPVTPDDYPELADDVMKGIIPGSSAGGEQPKFTAYCSERSAHVIVKFSPKGDAPLEKRWRDILITEYHATEIIHKYEFPAAETRLIEKDGRLFLESQRFDRNGEYGRMSMLSLQCIDAEFTGLGNNWTRVMRALQEKNLVSPQHVFDVEALWTFGRMVNNTDMHLGNLSLAIEDNVFRLLPVYDMCSMGFSPKAGSIAPYEFTPPAFEQFENQELALNCKNIAKDFWDNVSNDERISDEFKKFLERGNPIDLMQ